MAKIKNLERLRAKLRALPLELKKGIITALAKGAQDINDLQYHLCPLGATGHLRASIDWAWGEVPKGVSLSSHKAQSPEAEKDLLLSIYAGNEVAYYARWVEFGTQPARKGDRVPAPSRGEGATRISYRTHPGTRRQPFFYPGYRAGRKKAISSVVRASNLALKKAAAIGGSS